MLGKCAGHLTSPDSSFYECSCVAAQRRESDGNAYFLLDPAAKALEGKHPLAATLHVVRPPSSSTAGWSRPSPGARSGSSGAVRHPHHEGNIFLLH